MRLIGRNGLKRVLPLFILAVVGLSFQNCQPPTSFQIQQQNFVPDDSDVPVSIFPGESLNHERLTPDEAAAQAYRDGKIQIRKISGESLQAVSAKLGGRVRMTPEDRLIALVDNRCLDETEDSLSARLSRPEQRLENLNVQNYVWRLPADIDLAVFADEAERDPCLIGVSHDDVAYAGSNLSDPLLGQQLNFLAVGGPEAHSFFTDQLRGSTSPVIVAVIDSGINYHHPDLKNMLWKSTNGAYGYNFNNDTVAVMDDFGHGTAVSGVIAAQANNGVGIAGVMGHNIEIMTLKVQDSTGSASISSIVLAIDYARSRNVHVINISMEGNGTNASLQAALNAAAAAKIFTAVAAGNGGAEIGAGNVVIPAVYSTIAGVMAVGSIDSYSSQRSSFSNFSTSLVEIAAPGSNGILVPDRSSGYKNDQGTSFSSPMVAGAAALVVSFFKKNNINYDAALIENVLTTAAVQQSHLNTHFKQGRTLDLRALALHLQRTYLAPVDGGFRDD